MNEKFKEIVTWRLSGMINAEYDNTTLKSKYKIKIRSTTLAIDDKWVFDSVGEAKHYLLRAFKEKLMTILDKDYAHKEAKEVVALIKESDYKSDEELNEIILYLRDKMLDIGDIQIEEIV